MEAQQEGDSSHPGPRNVTEVLYENCVIQSPSGEMLSRCGRKKAEWYIKKGLAGGSGHAGDAYMLSEKENRCVVCGASQDLTKHHVVPTWYRKHFPEELKSHNSYDVVGLCSECHDVYEMEAMKLKEALSAEYGFNTKVTQYVIDFKLRRIKKIASALLQNRTKLPQQRVEEYENTLKEFYNKDNISPEDIKEACGLQDRVKNPQWVSHGRWVVGKFSSARDFEAFIERWRAHFLDTMNPRFLDTWEVTHHTRTAPTELGEGKGQEGIAAEVGQEAKRSGPEQGKGRGKKPRAVPAKPVEPKKIGVERPVYKWEEEGHRWRVINVVEEEEAARGVCERMKDNGKSELTFATWNVLFDLYQPELIKTHIRVPVILDILYHTDAEIVGLQEVTVPFLEKLLAEDWVRRRYYVSEITIPEEGKEGREGSTIHPSGQVLLARYPFRLHFHAFNYHKSVVIGEFPSLFPGERKLMVPVVHLTSEKSKSCVWQRKTQLNTIFGAIEQLGTNNNDGGNDGEEGKGKCSSVDCVMIGDFNFKDGPENQNIRADCLDVWPALHPGDPGLTFDVSKNSLAYITSSSRLSRRFDRVLILAGKEGSCKPLRIEMFATEPFYFDPALDVRELKSEEKQESEDREGKEKDGGEDKDIRKRVAEFKEDLEAEILELPPTLNAEQRKMVHLLATRYGLKHFSKGDEKQGTRVVVLQKRTEVKVEEAPIQEEVSVSQTLPHYPDDQEGKRPFFASDHFGLKCVLEFV